ncbi:MAG TPA: class I SAM-dependent methyltransferase, partial [Mucilaginibacter sp.]|nr:class I SAM-dependent methyltransferase [Mucilaginibacter sp.]
MDKIKCLYDDIGRGYNTTRQADAYLTGRLYYHLLPKDGAVYLDVGCGTGNYTTALANKGLDFQGIEPSEEMLGIARLRSSDVKWFTGKAENIPAEDALFDGAIATLT